MTEEEAHAELVKIVAKVALGTPVNIEETEVGIWRNALKALEKQIPKKPITIRHPGAVQWKCPCCDVFVMCQQWYCVHCGQKLDWSEKDD